jgi:hypothetical protein
MALQVCDAVSFVQSLAPTWRKTQQVMLAEMMVALQERPTLCLSDIARSLSAGAHASPQNPLHGRLKRIDRFLSNPRLDEVALWVRLTRLAYHFSADPPQPLSLSAGEDPAVPLLPLLLDTTYFEPYAALIVSIPCGSRGLPIALTTYQRNTLQACFPPASTWPSEDTLTCPPAARKGQPVRPASSVVRQYWSQNRIEERLLRYIWSFLGSGLRPVVVADRGFARASLLRWFLERHRDFVIRFDAGTWLSLPDGQSASARDILALRPGQCRWLPMAYYGKEERVPVAVLGLWDVGQKEPWYLATTLAQPQPTETLYRWRMRIECANRDEKSGVILREGSDQHRLTSALHLHRLLLVVLCLHWLSAWVGLQAFHDLPLAESAPANDAADICPLEQALPNTTDWALLEQGPAQPPAVLPHRGPTPKLPSWMRPFAARGWLSYIRLGMEILRTDLVHLVHRAVRWVAIYLWRLTPLWRPWQVRYRLKHWWPLPT